ncbi:ion channel [Pseudobdellovibrio sp. HCB154]|uniref:ion channel n=1 Tax=Pseudobdellovibrio sp. HCB154 TaxID=3386277 RepID=UPI003916DFE7
MARRTVTLTQYKSRFLALVKHPFFWFLTIFGNSVILLGSVLIYFFEAELSEKSLQFIDCILWSAGLVTTIGYADFTPQSLGGKIVVLTLMMCGTLFIWSYMGFLVTGMITPELSSLEQDVHDVEKEIKDMKVENQNLTKEKLGG